GRAVSAVDAIETESLAQVDLRRPDDVVADEQVKPAVTVVVEESGRGRKVDPSLPVLKILARRPAAGAAHAGVVGHVGKAPAVGGAANIMKQTIPAHAGDEDVRPAV